MSTTAEVVDKVRRLLVALDINASLKGETGFIAPFDETSVILEVSEIETWRDTLLHPVEVWAPVLFDVPLEPEFLSHVATSKFRFGGFEIHLEDDPPGATPTKAMLVFTHTILGDFLDKDELDISIGMVFISASNEIEDLQKRFGGRRPSE